MANVELRRPLIVGNWKATGTFELIRRFGNNLGAAINVGRLGKDKIGGAKVVICPPTPFIYPLRLAFEKEGAGSPEFGAQDISISPLSFFQEKKFAVTGEYTGGMLMNIGADWVIVGHSERRQYFRETNEIVNQKIKNVIEAGLKAIMCVGETLQQRESGKFLDVITDQMVKGLKDIENMKMEGIVAAYEPVWAIGTGKTASPEQAQEVHEHIRSKLTMLYGSEIAEKTRILYGGSVKPDNIDTLMAKPDIDGALVGGASLIPEDFARIVNFKI